MSIIVFYDRFVICDSITAAGNVRVTSHAGYRKVVRCPDGSLFGTVGDRMAGEALQSWAQQGLDFENPPKLFPSKDYDGAYRWALMRPDGRKFFGDMYMQMHEVGDDVLGEEQATDVAIGALGMIPALQRSLQLSSPQHLLSCAMHVVVERCMCVAAPIYIFDLDHPELDP